MILTVLAGQSCAAADSVQISRVSAATTLRFMRPSFAFPLAGARRIMRAGQREAEANRARDDEIEGATDFRTHHGCAGCLRRPVGAAGRAGGICGDLCKWWRDRALCRRARPRAAFRK